MNQQPAPGEPAPHALRGLSLMEAVWRHRWAVAAVTLLTAVAGYGASMLQPTMYEAKAQLLLADPRNAGVFRDVDRISLDPSRYVRNQAQFVASRAVALRAAELVDGRLSSDDVLERVQARPSVDLDLIEIRASATGASAAARLANAVAQAYQDRVSEEVTANAAAAIKELEQSNRNLQQRIDAAERGLAADGGNSALRAERDAAIAQLITIEGRANQIAVDAALYGSGVELFERAEPPEAPAQPKPVRNAILVGLLGLLAASAVSWWHAERSRAADSRDDPARVLGVPLLGEIPEYAEVGATGPSPTVSAPHSVAAEAYQFVVASLQFALGEIGGSSVLITSASPGDGKTVTALNIAAAAAQDGRRVVLVDCDERMRGLTALSGLRPAPGLTDLGDEHLPFQSCLAGWKLSERVTLPFVPAGSQLPDPAGYFRTPAFRRAVRRIKEFADLAIIDSPPLLAVSDSSAIASQVDGIVVVVEHRTPLTLLEDVARRLQFVGTPVLGYVFNRAPARSGYGARYGYGYGYGYGRPAPAEEEWSEEERTRGGTGKGRRVRARHKAGRGSRA